MPETKPEEIIVLGAERWNAWMEHHPAGHSFLKPYWYAHPDDRGVQRKGKNDLDFSGMSLSHIEVHKAFAEGLNMRNADVRDVMFEEGDFSAADFSGTTFRNTRFNKTILTRAKFNDATFINCSLNRVNLTGAEFRVREITETVVYGVSAWDLKTHEGMKQSRLVIEPTYELYSDIIARGEVPLMVDDIELAQFVYYLSNHKKMRDAISILNDRGVLLLGRFKAGGLERLYEVRKWLAKKGYMPMIFDFERPPNLSLTETGVTMATLSKFVFADLSGGSVPHELQAIAPQIKKPVVAFGDPYAMFPDVADHTTVIEIGDDDASLFARFERCLPEIEAHYARRVRLLAERYERKQRQVPPGSAI